MLKTFYDKLQLNDKDTIGSSFLKGMGEGAMEYCMVVGVVVKQVIQVVKK